jgi:hypothetical protein
MTKEEMIEMAMLEAEFVSHGKPSEEESELFVCTDKDIVRFAKLIAEKEREECAKECEIVQEINEEKGNWFWEAKNCAFNIRARGK